MIVECEGVAFAGGLPCFGGNDKESLSSFSSFPKVCMKFRKVCVEFWLKNQSERFLDNSTLSLFDEELTSF